MSPCFVDWLNIAVFHYKSFPIYEYGKTKHPEA